MKKFFIATLSLLLFVTSAFGKTIELNTSNTLVYDIEVTSETTKMAQLVIEELVAKRGDADYPIYLVLDCPGGEIYSGEQFIQYAKTVPNLHTITFFAASMCAGFAEALPGRRYIVENGVLMFHRAQGQFQGYFEDGEVESQLALWKSIVRHMEKRNAARMCMSLEAYKDKIHNEWWVYGDDAVEAKAADEVVDVICSKELRAANACPLMR